MPIQNVFFFVHKAHKITQEKRYHVLSIKEIPPHLNGTQVCILYFQPLRPIVLPMSICSLLPNLWCVF